MTHLAQSIGWMSWASDGNVAGTEGHALQMEASSVKATGLQDGSMRYQAHLADVGWQGWAHSANIGWQTSVGEGGTAGTTGRSLCLEALRLSFPDFDGAGSAIVARAHVSDVGWMGWSSSGSVIGTTGQGRAMEAVEIRVVPKGAAFSRGGSATVQPRPVSQPPAPVRSWYEEEVEGFLSDARWRGGASWSSGQRPKIASYGASGCCAYAVDFCKYVFGEDSYRAGEEFYDPAEIRAGDVIKVTGSQHWFVVLGRSGGSLYTAEGNWGGRVVVAEGTYTVSGNTLCRNGSRFRTFSVGYHML